MPAWMPIILGGMLAWNLLTDWVWIGNSLHFLPSNYQKDLQTRARDIVDTMNAAKSILYTAQREKRSLTAGESGLIRTNADSMEKAIWDMSTFYTAKFVSYGAAEAVKGLMETRTTLLLQLADLRAAAGITSRAAVAGAKIEAFVDAVHDGDTVTLDNKEVVRLVGIDAPESTTTAGQASKRFLASLILYRRVKVTSDPAHLKDMYGRRLGVIWLDSRNINVEMLSNSYAIFYAFEPNSEVYEKVWKAAAEEGKSINIAKPLADLKEMRAFSYEKLRLWKSEERAAQKALIDEEKERYKSEQNESLEALKDDYAAAKEWHKAEHARLLDEITAAYKAKTITLEERASRRAKETTRYLDAKAGIQKTYTDAKAAIKDPYKTQKAALSKLLLEKYKEINTLYAATRKEISGEYIANVAAIKKRENLPYAAEPEMPPSVAAPIFVAPAPPVAAPPVVAPPVVAPPVVAPPVVAPPVVAPPVVAPPVVLPKPIPPPPTTMAPPYIFGGIKYEPMLTRYFVRGTPGGDPYFEIFVSPSPNVPYGMSEITKQEALSLAQRELTYRTSKGHTREIEIMSIVIWQINSAPAGIYFASIPGLGTFVPLATAIQYFWYLDLEKAGKIKNVGTSAAPLWVST